MPFNVGGLQYFGVLEISSNGVSATPSLTEIYNNTGFTFTPQIIVGSTSAFRILAGLTWGSYSYSVTLTPINLKQASQSVIPFYIFIGEQSANTLQFNLADWEGNDYSPNAIDDSISYYINIRLT